MTEKTATTLLALENVTVGYGRHVVLQDISLSLPRGGFTGLLGANGSGKSTLIRTILGIVPPLSGRVQFHDIDGRAPVLAYTPQRESLDSIFLLSSFEIVLMGTCGRVGPGKRINSTEKDWVQECLRETGAEQLSKTLFSQLSGGQKQRVLMARALATKPDFLLLDEPTSGIDAAARQAIMEVLQRIQKQRQLTVVMASHDFPLVRANVQQVIWLHAGRLLQGSPQELLKPEKIEEILEMQLG